MPWVLVAFAVMWVLALLFIIALCVSARRTDKKIIGADDAAAPPLSTIIESPAGIEDTTVRRPALS